MARVEPRALKLDLGGGIVATALHEGGVPGKSTDYLGYSPDRIENILAEAGQEVPPNPDLSVLLIEAGKRILVDTGAGDVPGFGPGAMMKSLSRIGLEPADIDMVFVTHLHGDHCGGLTDLEGRPEFPNARIFVHKPELDHAGDRPEVRRRLAPYADRLTALEGADWLPGIVLKPLPGHTPGHCGLTIGAGLARKLEVVGDLLHLPEIQLQDGPFTTRYDWDPVEALTQRTQVLSEAVDTGNILMGMHFRWPPFRTVRRIDGGFVLDIVPEAKLIPKNSVCN